MRTYGKFQWYRDYKENLEAKENLRFRERDYLNYLHRWFSNEICDGAIYENRNKWERLPMSFIQYVYHYRR